MTGKLSTPQLKRNVLDLLQRRRAEVLTSAAVGEDCAVLKLDGLILATSDPITGAERNAGSLAVYVSSNDIAASGGEPVAAIMTIIAPEGRPEADIKTVVMDAERAAKQLNIEIAGGHTEYSDAVNRIVVSCTMLGVARVPGRVFSSTDIAAGQTVLLTGYAAGEFTAIAAYDREETARKVLTEEEFAAAQNFRSSLSVLEEAAVCCRLSGVTAMHDVTEGGVLGALGELLDVTGLGAELTVSAIPVHPATEKLCRAFHIRPLEAISSGNLLIVTGQPEAAIAALAERNILVSRIGKIADQPGIREGGEK